MLGDNEIDTEECVFVYNTLKDTLENFKFVRLPFGVTITSANFGPYDNGYLLLGLSNGVLLALEVPSLQLILQEQIFDNKSIDIIQFEPTSMAILCSKETGELAGISPIKKEVRYLYVQTEDQ